MSLLSVQISALETLCDCLESSRQKMLCEEIIKNLKRIDIDSPGVIVYDGKEFNTMEEMKEYKKGESKVKPLAPGDKVKVLTREHHFMFAIGTIGTVAEITGPNNCTVIADDDFWHYSFDELEKVELK